MGTVRHVDVSAVIGEGADARPSPRLASVLNAPLR
jgi:hypothetical protein